MKVKLQDVRLLFPNLWTPRHNDNGPAKFGGTFAFPPDHPAVGKIMQAIGQVITEKWGADKAGEVFNGLRAADRLCLHDGALKAQKYQGYEGQLYVNASNEAKPPVFDSDAQTELTIQDGYPYSGCYVDAMIDVWGQKDHPKGGSRVNAALMGVMFRRHGDRLAGAGVASADDFDAVPMEGTENGAAGLFGGGNPFGGSEGSAPPAPPPGITGGLTPTGQQAPQTPAMPTPGGSVLPDPVF